MKTISPQVGENTTLKLIIPKALHEPKYAQVLQKTAANVSIAGFRKGKAPRQLVAETVGHAKLFERVLEDVLPQIYAQAVQKANISPLVPPQVKIVSIEPGQDWIVDAHTAIAPAIKLGDWKKTVRAAAKTPAKTATKQDTAEADSETEKAILSQIFAALTESINPPIPPLLIEHEARRQLEELASSLAKHRIEFEHFLKSTGKTAEQIEQEYLHSGHKSMQIEFILQAITDELSFEIADTELETALGKKLSAIPKTDLDRTKAQLTSILKRQKALKELVKLSQQ